MSIYVKLASFYPNKTLIEIIPKLIGKYLAYPVIYFYIAYFIYTAGRACRDFGDLIGSTILDETPLVVVIGSFMVLVVYCLRGGVEIFGRMGEAVFPIFMFSLIIVWILLLSVESIHFTNFNPILGNGVKPILKEVHPKILNFPFGETVIIMMFLPFLKNQKNAGKVGLAVILIGGILLAINSVLILSVVGSELYQIDYFPLQG